MSDSTYTTLFQQLSELLAEHRHLWQPLAFHTPVLPWQQNYPELAARLANLSQADAEVLQANDRALAEFLEVDIPAAQHAWQLCQLPRAEQQPLTAYPHSFECDIPGRKWQQIQAYVGAVAHNSEPSETLPILEWCGGKGHLGRCLSQQLGVDGESVDINEALVAKGQHLSHRFGLPLRHFSADALAISGWHYIQPQQHIHALHACGGLHLTLIEKAIERGVQQLSIAPCCYHLFLSESFWSESRQSYKPQSKLGQSLDLKLSLSDLRTSVQQTVTAPAHDQRLRKTLQAWRLGFDALQRHLRGADEYLPVPTLANRWAKTSFMDVCQHIAALKNIDLPEFTQTQWQDWEQQSWQRLQQVTAFDLVRMAFRRPLELWLVLDRAITLQEAGYKVNLSEFCEQSLTPRNILIEAALT